VTLAQERCYPNPLNGGFAAVAPKCEIAALQNNQHLYKITSTWMTNTLWLQMSGAIAGGLVGSCAGVPANIIRARLGS
jgi:hypothetical protein